MAFNGELIGFFPGRRGLRPFLSCQLGFGNNALFWHDDWTGLGPLIDLTGANGPRVSGIPRLSKFLKLFLAPLGDYCKVITRF